jgi:hypothetical protein
MRFNDGRVDPAGRFWVGTMYEPRDQPKAEMYVLEAASCARPGRRHDQLERPGLDPDGKTMFHADTTSHRIDVYDYDLATGTHSNGRNLVTFEADKTTGTYGGRPGRRRHRQRRQLLDRDVRRRPHPEAVADRANCCSRSSCR